jgi:hypothetical protein
MCGDLQILLLKSVGGWSVEGKGASECKHTFVGAKSVNHKLTDFDP